MVGARHVSARPVGAAGALVVEEHIDAVAAVETLEDAMSPEGLLLPLPNILQHHQNEPFRYCLNTATLRGHNVSLSEFVDIAAAAGFEAVEIWIGEIDRFLAEGGDLRDLASHIQDLGLTVEGGLSTYEWIVDDPQRRAKGFEEARRCMGLLARLGGKRISAPPYGAHGADASVIALQAAAERYRMLLALGDEMRVAPQIEFWGASANVSRLSDAALIAIDSGHPDAAILADVYELYKGGSPLSGLRLLGPDALRIFHVNDYPPLSCDSVTDADRVYPGDGVAPLRSLLLSLRDIGFSGVLSLELFNPVYEREAPLTVARTGLEKLRAVVQESLEP